VADPAHPGYVEKKYVSRYMDVPNDALFPFGHGLSYTSFNYAEVSVSVPNVSAATLKRQAVKATATVTNTGKRRATEIVECYVGVLGASIEQPVRRLKGFRRITLDPGQTKSVEFPLGFDELSFFGAQNRPVVEPETDYTVWIGGSSTAPAAAYFKMTR
jgi:beta-glucosidase